MCASRQGSLGVDFYWGRTRRNTNYVVVKRRTNREKFRSSLRALKEWIKRARSWRLRGMLAVLRRKLQGYWNYYGVRGNSNMLSKYDLETKRLLYKWLNRRSQKRSMTWTQFNHRLGFWDLPPPRIVERV